MRSRISHCDPLDRKTSVTLDEASRADSRAPVSPGIAASPESAPREKIPSRLKANRSEGRERIRPRISVHCSVQSRVPVRMGHAGMAAPEFARKGGDNAANSLIEQ